MGFKMKVFSKINFKWTAAYVVEYQVTLTTIVLVTVYVIYLYLCGIYIYTPGGSGRSGQRKNLSLEQCWSIISS